MTKDQIKQLILERVMEARIYGDPYRTSDEYDLTPEEISAIRNMDHKQRMNFALKKLKQARREKGQCISGGPKCEIPPTGPDGKPGPYCKKHLESFRAARQKLVKKRGSCSRCPNPPEPGKKLCKSCKDELEMIRLKALEAGLCIRCKKKPMESNEKGEQTLFCRDCMKVKVALNKRRKIFKKGWEDYGKDVVATIKDRQRKPTELGEMQMNRSQKNWDRLRSTYNHPSDRKDWSPEDWSTYMDSLAEPREIPEKQPRLRKQRVPAKPKSRWKNLRHVLKKMLRTGE